MAWRPKLDFHTGDAYNMREMMVVDGLGTCIGALFGSFLPTTVYLGHPIHKKYGATAGYSILNAVVFFTVLNAGIYPLRPRAPRRSARPRARRPRRPVRTSPRSRTFC